jgi:uncharacterized protein (DUF433 family)
MTAADIIGRIDALPAADREAVYHHLVAPVEPPEYPGIRRTTGVCGGSACVRDFRIPVWSLEEYRRQGMAEADLLALFPQLTADDLAHAWAYVAGNAGEIEQAITANVA